MSIIFTIHHHHKDIGGVLLKSAVSLYGSRSASPSSLNYVSGDKLM